MPPFFFIIEGRGSLKEVFGGKRLQSADKAGKIFACATQALAEFREVPAKAFKWRNNGELSANDLHQVVELLSQVESPAHSGELQRLALLRSQGCQR